MSVLPPPRLWDFAGVDGLSAARALFGEAAARLSVWQSLDTAHGSLLRLCEGNFRVGLSGGDPGALEAALHEAARGRRLWVRAAQAAAFLAEDSLERLLPAAIVKPPHRLAGLPPGRAVPARLDGRAVLLWRHTVGGTPTLEVHNRRARRRRRALRTLPVGPVLRPGGPPPKLASPSVTPPRTGAATDKNVFVRAHSRRKGETS